ncbi:MAG: hypothetical protein HOV87_26850 [Catenulispora sp.]|nr:hypothetical protein [Catenulispora sp.]
MSVIMTLRIEGNAEALEKYAQEHKQEMKTVLGAAKSHGLIGHRFYGSQDGSGLIVVDEWPDRQSFESFYEEQADAIRPMFEAAQPKGEPTPMYWEELETGDAYGWGA